MALWKLQVILFAHIFSQVVKDVVQIVNRQRSLNNGGPLANDLVQNSRKIS